MQRFMFFLALVLCLPIFSANLSAQDHIREIRSVPYHRESTDPYVIQRCVIDLYLPTTTSFPTLIWFHGGGLNKGQRDGKVNVAIGQRFAARGIAFASVGYRLSPTVKYPTYIEDSAAAVAYISKNIAAHGGDPKRLFISGHSAGGYLALMLALDSHYLNKVGIEEHQIAGYLPLAGQTVTHNTVRAERQLHKNTIIVDDAAPLYFIRDKTQPLFLFAADNDAPARAEENKLLYANFIAVGNKSVTFHLAGNRTHETLCSQLADPDDPVRLLMEAFINQR
jgi:acetyl esterase/lipase